MGKIFSECDERAWERWVDHSKGLEIRELYNLLSDEKVKQHFKERVIFILLAPHWKPIPFYFGQGNEQSRWFEKEFIKNLSPELAEYTAELVKVFYKEIIGKGDPNRYSTPLDFYNSCILDLLPLLADREAEELFELFHLNNFTAFRGAEEASGYDYFRIILNSNVDIKFKIMAEIKMRQIICDESKGKSKPRVAWERAIICYKNILLEFLYKKVPYRVGIYSDQISFVINSDKDEKYCLLYLHDLEKYFKLFRGSKRKAIRLKITKYIISHRNSQKICDYGEMESLKMILEESRDVDPEFAKILEKIIKESKENIEKNKREEEEKKKKEKKALEEILELMY